jgi:hypothetical protein
MQSPHTGSSGERVGSVVTPRLRRGREPLKGARRFPFKVETPPATPSGFCFRLKPAAGDDRSCSYVIRPHPAGVQFTANGMSRRRNGWSEGRIQLAPMHRLLVLYPPPSDPDHFRSYYKDTHLPLVTKFPGLRGCRYSFDVAAGEGESPYFCVFEADFDDGGAECGEGVPRGSGGARGRPELRDRRRRRVGLRTPRRLSQGSEAIARRAGLDDYPRTSGCACASDRAPARCSPVSPSSSAPARPRPAPAPPSPTGDPAHQSGGLRPSRSAGARLLMCRPRRRLCTRQERPVGGRVWVCTRDAFY